MLNNLRFIFIKAEPKLIEKVSVWFSSKWSVPKKAYFECMKNYLNNKTKLGWYLCLDNDKIIGGLGVIENDFHERKDLAPEDTKNIFKLWKNESTDLKKYHYFIELKETHELIGSCAVADFVDGVPVIGYVIGKNGGTNG